MATLDPLSKLRTKIPQAMRYLESEHSVRFAHHSLRIKYQPSEETMMIDLSTIASLELIQNLHNSKSKNCLFGLLNQTLTPMGARMLRSNILQPSTQQDGVLDPRYDALDELSSKEDMFYEIRKGIPRQL
jgi:DNA mismatch repair protein MSH4